LIDGFRSEFDKLLQDGNACAREIVEGFRPIPKGEFTMGSPPNENGRYGDEQLHQVRLTQTFSLHRFPVTNAQFELFDASHVAQRPNSSRAPDQPVVNVSWYEAWCFSRWVRLKEAVCCLPTEAQWERGCRGGKDTAYWFGNDPKALPNHAWFEDNSGDRTHSLAESEAAQGHINHYGLVDMHGNVWEWCEDWYAEDYGGTPGTVMDPKGPPRGSLRVHRGGSWNFSPRNCRSASRSRFSPGDRFYDLGCRLALVPSRELSSSRHAAESAGASTTAGGGHQVSGGAAPPEAGLG
jgi:formylglycine-generating enzyme required for sulfatase activity